jgi:nucleoside-diphosphate-sugar epimerase
VYVTDTAEGFVRLAECDAALGEDVNIATQQEIRIGALAALLTELCGSDAVIVGDEERMRPGKSEVERLLGDNTKLKRLTGWAPACELATGLKHTIEWFSRPENIAGYKADIYNV